MKLVVSRCGYNERVAIVVILEQSAFKTFSFFPCCGQCHNDRSVVHAALSQPFPWTSTVPRFPRDAFQVNLTTV